MIGQLNCRRKSPATGYVGAKHAEWCSPQSQSAYPMLRRARCMQTDVLRWQHST